MPCDAVAAEPAYPGFVTVRGRAQGPRTPRDSSTRERDRDGDVRSVIFYEPTGQQIDLGAPVDSMTFTWLESQNGYKFRCGACQTLLYMRHNPGHHDKLHGVHQADQGCQDVVVRRAAPMSDEHKRACEYHALAAQAAGLSADMEVTTSARTRVDVVVDNRLGFEIQHSGASIGAVRGRTKRSLESGLEAVTWFTDSQHDPLWYGLVPSYGSTMRSWDYMPEPRSAIARGVRSIEAVRCSFDSMPLGHRRPCGGYHPREVPRSVLIDDVVTRMAAGEIVAAPIGKYVRLLDLPSFTLYQELTAGTYQSGSMNVRRLAERIECDRPPTQVPAAKVVPIQQAELVLRCARCGAQHLDREPCPQCGSNHIAYVPPAPWSPKRGWRHKRSLPPGTCKGPGCNARPPGGADYCQACRLSNALYGRAG